MKSQNNLPKEHSDSLNADVLVVCPRCEGCARVQNGTRLICAACGLTYTHARHRTFGDAGVCFERSETLSDWYGWLSAVPVGPCSCHKCGNTIELQMSRQLRQNIVRIKDQAEGVCPTCNAAKAVDFIWVPCMAGDEPRERSFGTRLYLVEETPKGLLFAFNRDHAEKLLAYVSADQRGQAAAGHETMFALLPGWMKAARNRALVEKTLKRLIEKAIQ